MPFKEVEYCNDDRTKALVEKAAALAGKINARCLVFHPLEVKDFEAIKAPLPACIENMNRKPQHKGLQTPAEISQILEKHSWLGFVLDVNHAVGNNIPLENFFSLKEKLFGIHCAATWWKNGKRKEHGFLVEADQKQLQEIRKISGLKAPKIIEADFYPEKVSLIEKEIAMLKTWENR